MGDSRKHENLGYQYCLTVIDIFSKYVWVKQLKSKEASGWRITARHTIVSKDIVKEEGTEKKKDLVVGCVEWRGTLFSLPLCE